MARSATRRARPWLARARWQHRAARGPWRRHPHPLAAGQVPSPC